MTTTPTTNDWQGRTAYDPSGNKIGTVDAVYVDDETGRPAWFTVSTGWFGTSQSFVPIQGTERQDDDLIVAYDKDLIKDAPRVDDDGHISPAEQDRLFAHYHIARTSSTGRGKSPGTQGTTGKKGTKGTKGTVGRDTSGRTTDDAMTRSEEHLTGRAEETDTERVRLRKWVETEHESVTVPVRKEKVRLEREPITDANRDKAMSGRELSEDEHEVVLHEEHAVVDKETKPVERVKLGKDVEIDEERVDADVRKERIDVERDKRDKRDRK
jgi:uncharacterized protein (TIGR02271 family)